MSSTSIRPDAHAARRARQIKTEVVRSVYLHSPATTTGSLIAGFVLVAVMWNVVSNAMLVTWLAALLAHQAVRIHHYRSYVKAGAEDQAADRWGRLYVLAATIAGCIWGSAGFLMFVPESIAHQAFLSLVLYGIATVSMTALSAYAPAFYVLIPLTLVPFIVRMLIEPGSVHVFLAAPAVIVLGMALALGRNVNRLIVETLEKRFENLDLIDELSQQSAIAERARAEAEAANRSKTQFFAAASHDLRQPLHAVGLFTAALREKSEDPEIRSVVSSINASVAALDSLFNALLDVSKIDAGAVKAERAHFSINNVLDHLRIDFEPEAREKNLKLRIRPCKALVHSDPLLLERILRNLISNALRYTRKGGVLAGCRRSGTELRIEVWDTGVGIPLDQQDKIFEEFYQVGNPERSSAKGMGLGLAIVKRLSQVLGHDLALASVPGRGSVFCITVPIGSPPPPAARATPDDRSAAESALAGRFIVVIDDEPAIVEGMKVLLDQWGVRTLCAASSDNIVDAVAGVGALPDLIIADYQLAGRTTGIEVITRLRHALDPEIPGVVITGSNLPERVAEAEASGCELLLKPILADKLRSLISRKLRQPADAGPDH